MASKPRPFMSDYSNCRIKFLLLRRKTRQVFAEIFASNNQRKRNIVLNNRIAALTILLVSAVGIAWACTSAIVGRDASATGRPLLWKHRDTGFENNFVARVSARNASELDFVALFNAGDSTLSEAWIGLNSAGFAVMNTASYNLVPDTARYKDMEGVIMAKALRRCKSLNDFEDMLDSLPRPMGVQANFGAIDAFGAGAYYETCDTGYVKYSLAEAENGVLIRTNYSYSGADGSGFGYIRERNAQCLLAPYMETGKLSPELFTDLLSRSFYHSLLDKDFSTTGDRWVIDQDFIPRCSSSASIVIEGVAPGENPRLSIMWTELGYPPCSYVVPVTVDSVPEELQPNPLTWHSALCDSVVARKHEVFSIVRGSGSHYLNITKLVNAEGTGYSQQGAIRSRENYRKGYEYRDSLKNSLK